jgi:polyhydroxyalkanoate synthesis regulator phasin
MINNYYNFKVTMSLNHKQNSFENYVRDMLSDIELKLRMVAINQKEIEQLREKIVKLEEKFVKVENVKN